MPVYNVERYIERSIQSVLSQTFDDFELIIWDDGSTDNSGNIANKYELIDDRIVVYHDINEGLLATRRKLLKKAEGEIIVFLDSDDELKIDCLETIDNYRNIYHADCVFFEHMEISEVDEELQQSPALFQDGEIISIKQMLNIFLSSDKLNSIWSKAAIKKMFAPEKSYSRFGRLSMGEDKLQSIDIIKNNPKVVYCAKPLYRYRQNSKSMSRNIQLSYSSDYIRIREEMIAEFSASVVKEEFEKQKGTFINSLIWDHFKYLVLFQRCGYDKKEIKEKIWDFIDSSLLKEVEYHKNQLKWKQRIIYQIIYVHRLESCINIVNRIVRAI